MSALDALDSFYHALMELLKELDFPEKLHSRLISKIMNIAIRCTYCIFCRRNNDWSNPSLMDFKTFYPIFSILSCYIVNTIITFLETANFTLPVSREVYYCNLVVIFL